MLVLFCLAYDLSVRGKTRQFINLSFSSVSQIFSLCLCFCPFLVFVIYYLSPSFFLFAPLVVPLSLSPSLSGFVFLFLHCKYVYLFFVSLFILQLISDNEIFFLRFFLLWQKKMWKHWKRLSRSADGIQSTHLLVEIHTTAERMKHLKIYVLGPGF